MSKAQIFRWTLPWLIWAGVAIVCAAGYLLFLTRILNKSGAWIGGPTLIVTPVLVMGFALLVWVPFSWAMTKWYRRPTWVAALVVSGALGSPLLAILGISLFNTSGGTPFFGWFLLFAFMAGASSHAHLINIRQNRE
ncbi:MAG: hypothetical protein ACTSY1_00200 [Alphaproteobacteria bacterium]